MHISDILDSKGRGIHAVPHGTPLSDELALMRQHRIGSVVVVHRQTGQALGIVSQPELLEGLVQMGPDALCHCVTGIMRKPAPSCDASATVQEALSQMTRERSRHLLVCDETSLPVGLVSLGIWWRPNLRMHKWKPGCFGKSRTRANLPAAPGQA